MIVAVVVFAVICYLVVYGIYRHFAKSRATTVNGKIDDSCLILGEIRTNNTYLPILDVFTSLDQALVKYNMELHTNLRGYLDNGNA